MSPHEELRRDAYEERSGLLERFWVAALSAAFLYLVLFRKGVPLYLFPYSEGGAWIDEAQRVLDGEVMYRDFFELITPGIVYLNAAVLYAFGPRVSTLGFASVVLGTVAASAFHSLSARVVGRGWRLLPPAVFVVLLFAPHSQANHRMPALLFGLLGLLLLLERAAATVRSFLAGALLGLSAVFTLDFGLGMAGGTALYLLTGRARALRRHGLVFVAGCLAMISLAMGYFVWKAGPLVVLHDCVVFPLTRYRHFFTFDLFDGLTPRTLAYHLLSAGEVASAVALLARRNAGEPARLIAFAGLGLLAATAHRPLTSLLLATRCAPLTVTLAWGMERLSRRPERLLAWLSRAALGVIVVRILWGSLALVARRQWLEPLTKERHRAGEVWVSSPLAEVSWVESQTAEGERVFLLPAKGGLHFLSRTRSATSIPYLMLGQSPEEHLRRVLADIDETKPSVGVWLDAANLPLLHRGLLERYEAEGKLPNGNTIFRRKGASTR